MFRAFQATLGCMVQISDPLGRFVRWELRAWNENPHPGKKRPEWGTRL
jgi:hypothetical protein